MLRRNGEPDLLPRGDYAWGGAARPIQGLVRLEWRHIPPGRRRDRPGVW